MGTDAECSRLQSVEKRESTLWIPGSEKIVIDRVATDAYESLTVDAYASTPMV